MTITVLARPACLARLNHYSRICRALRVSPATVLMPDDVYDELVRWWTHMTVQMLGVTLGVSTIRADFPDRFFGLDIERRSAPEELLTCSTCTDDDTIPYEELPGAEKSIEMRYFEILTRLEPPQLNNPGGARLTTRIRQDGAKEVCNGVELHMELLDAQTFSYILDHHIYQIKQRLIDEANAKLDNIADIADPDER